MIHFRRAKAGGLSHVPGTLLRMYAHTYCSMPAGGGVADGSMVDRT